MLQEPVTHLCCPGPPGSTQRRQPQGLHQSPCPLSPGGLSHTKASTHWHILKHAKYRSKSFPKLIAKEISKGVTYYFMTRTFYFITETFPIKEFPSPSPAVQYLPICLDQCSFLQTPQDLFFSYFSFRFLLCSLSHVHTTPKPSLT